MVAGVAELRTREEEYALPLDEGRGPPLIIRHKSCGAKLIPKIVCNRCDGNVDHLNVTSPHAEALQSLRSKADQ